MSVCGVSFCGEINTSSEYVPSGRSGSKIEPFCIKNTSVRANSTFLRLRFFICKYLHLHCIVIFGYHYCKQVEDDLQGTELERKLAGSVPCMIGGVVIK